MPDTPILRLSIPLNIYNAAEAKALVLEACDIPQGQTLEADLSGCPDIDASGVQILLLARKACLARGSRFAISAASPAVSDILSFLRLLPLFDPKAAG